MAGQGSTQDNLYSTGQCQATRRPKRRGCPHGRYVGRMEHTVTVPASQFPRPECSGSRFFAAIQSIQYKQQVHGIKNLIKAVSDAFQKTRVEALDNIFISLQMCMMCILECDGGNDYKLPHMGKRHREGKVSSQQQLPLIKLRFFGLRLSSKKQVVRCCFSHFSICIFL